MDAEAIQSWVLTNSIYQHSVWVRASIWRGEPWPARATVAGMRRRRRAPAGLIQNGETHLDCTGVADGQSQA